MSWRRWLNLNSFTISIYAQIYPIHLLGYSPHPQPNTWTLKEEVFKISSQNLKSKLCLVSTKVT